MGPGPRAGDPPPPRRLERRLDAGQGGAEEHLGGAPHLQRREPRGLPERLEALGERRVGVTRIGLHLQRPPERLGRLHDLVRRIRYPGSKALKSYIEQFDQRFKTPVSGFGGYAYDAMQLLARAIAFADPVTGQSRQFESRLRLQWP